MLGPSQNIHTSKEIKITKNIKITQQVYKQLKSCNKLYDTKDFNITQNFIKDQ